MRVVTVPALSDNYAYLVVDDARRCAVVIDPSEADPVENALAREGLALAGILNTHHHWDHVGGNEKLVARHRCPVLAPFDDALKIPSCTRTISDESEQEVGGFRFRALHVPGHTLGAATYLFGDAAFTGDTLFLLGCGRLFEGTAEEMFRSFQRLAALPASTQIFCGHEYVLSNLAFAESVDPSNISLRRRGEKFREARRLGEPSVPALLSDELLTNPFLRAADAEAFSLLRQAKDAFRA